MNLKDKVVLITGGASGIGKASGLKLGQDGAKIAICDIDKKNGQKTEKEFKNKDIDAKFFQCDVTDESSVEKAVKSVKKNWGKIDVAFLNAGIEGPNKKVPEIDYSDWKKTFEINVNGVFLCAKNVLPIMEKQGFGNIIITSSNLGMFALPNKAAYCSTKGALIMLGKSIAVDYKNEDIRANIICPGPVKTPLVTSRWEEIEDPEESAKVKEAIMNIPQLMEVEEVANTVYFLASDASKAYNGETFVIDKGAQAELVE
ncbi:MAG: SDR family oxidoreductase [Candidatus Cloacimonetes bacterium]|nr:SDR family oxidoreductase [Candidatus Cloacimonadota bacterium]